MGVTNELWIVNALTTEIRPSYEVKVTDLVDEAAGVVFHHPDGRMAKIKRSDFGLAWS